MQKNKNYFLRIGGDKYYKRNVDSEVIIKKSVLYKVLKKNLSKNKNILEIGCSDGKKLILLKKKYRNCNFYGIDPSTSPLNNLKKNKINYKVGTADELPFRDNFFDIIVYGFCLYLCDDDLLFKIASEGFRCLRPGGIIIIEDFVLKKPVYKKYIHKRGILTRKMDYVSMFEWHPKIKLIKTMKYLHPISKKKLENYVTVAILKKNEKIKIN